MWFYIIPTERLESAAPVQIETVDKRNLSPEKCSSILERHFPQSVKGSKILESLYLKYIYTHTHINYQDYTYY